MVSGLFVSMLLAFGSGLASHVPGEGGNIMTPMEYVERNVSGYLKDWINTYRAEDGKVNGYQVDLPSFLYSHWCNDNEPEDMSCSITEDCAVPSHSKLKGERDNDDYVEFLPGNQDAHYAIFKSIANFHGLHKHLYDVSQQDQLGAQGSLAGMAEKFAWARKMDNWRDGDARRKTLLAHKLLTAELTLMPFLALPWAGFSTGMAVSASALAGTVTGSLGGAWAGTAALVTDRFAKSENRNGDLVADASMWLAQQNQAMRMTADFNLRHLFNGGDLGGYDLADFLQFGSFLIDYDFLDYHRISNVQQTSMVIDRLWKEDRVYILDIDSAKHSHVDSGTTCGNNEFRLTDNAGTDIRDARKVCLSEYPNREFWIFSWPRDGEAQAGAAKLVKDWYPPEKQRRARGIAGAADIDSVSLGFDWEDVVRSSKRAWDRSSNEEANNAALWDEGRKLAARQSSGALFTVPICTDPTMLAVQTDHEKHQRGWRMPQGPPAVCGEFYHDLNTWDALDKHRKSHRFLNALGVPNEHDVKYGLNSITHNGETIQYVEMSKGDKDQKDLLLCAQDDTTDDGRLLEYCNKRNDNHGSHYIHRGKPWPVALPAKDPPCLDDIPRDSALGGIPVVQLGVDGCPLLRDGQMIPLNLRIGGYRNWDWRAGHFIH